MSATRRIYGECNLNNYGPGIMMPDSSLDRIVDCAYQKKIITIEDLRKETRWSGVDQFGSEVIAIIHHIIPVPIAAPLLSPPTPLQSHTLSRTSNDARKQSRCSACNMEGHNSMSNFFSLKILTISSIQSAIAYVHCTHLHCVHRSLALVL